MIAIQIEVYVKFLPFLFLVIGYRYMQAVVDEIIVGSVDSHKVISI